MGTKYIVVLLEVCKLAWRNDNYLYSCSNMDSDISA